MAYAKRYTTTFATQSGDDITIELWEDGATSVTEYPCNMFNFQYIPKGDDPYEPIYASQIEVVIDVTDAPSAMPDFTSLNDRKYHTKVIQGGNLIWQGWTLSDNIQYSFSTGAKEITFNAVCGLGMLKDITFSEALETPINEYKSIAYIIAKCLYDVGIQQDIFASCSIFAEAMNDRGDNTNFDPFNQSYIQLSGIQDNNGQYIDSQTLLRNLLLSFGCRVYQCAGRWNIIQINQITEAAPYYTLYDYQANILSSGTFNPLKNIPNDAIFIGGGQTKMLSKGFNNIISEKDIEFPDNYIFNASLKLNDTVDALGWVRTNTGSGAVFLIEKSEQESNYWELSLNGGGAATAQVENTERFLIAKGDIINFKYKIVDSTPATSPSGNDTCLMLMFITDGTLTYYVSNSLSGNKKGTWKLFTGVAITDHYEVDNDPITVSKNFESLPAPITGLVYVGFKLQFGVTGEYLLVGEFAVTAISDLKKVSIKSEITDSEAYTKKIEFPFGVNSNVVGKYSYKGFISDVNGNMFIDWYNYERPGNKYYSLAILMVQNYINQFRKNTINIDSTIEGNVNANNVFQFDDTDPTQINVSAKKYIIGNSTFMPIVNELQTTFLEVSNTNQNATITVKYTNLTQGTEPTTNCVSGANFEVVVSGDISYSTCEGVGVIQNSGGIGPGGVSGCIQYGSVLPYYGNGTPATISDISYGSPCG